MVNLGTFELDEDGNDVEELARRRAARKRRREESRRRQDDSDDSIIECSSPVAQGQPQTQKRATRNAVAKTGATQAPEVIVLDSDEGEAAPPITQTPMAKRRRRVSPKRATQPDTLSPHPRSPSSPREPSPPRLPSPIPPPQQCASDYEQSFEILPHPPSPKEKQPEKEDEAEDGPLTYEPGQLQDIYDNSLQGIIERTRDLPAIVPRKKHKAFPLASRMDSALLSPKYTQDYSRATPGATNSIWSRSVPNWVSPSSSSTWDEICSRSKDDKDITPTSTSAAEVEGLLLNSQLSDRLDGEDGGDFVQGRNDDFSAAEDNDKSDMTMAPEASLTDTLAEAIHMSDIPLSQIASARAEDFASTTSRTPTPPTLSMDGGRDKSPSRLSFAGARVPSATPSPPVPTTFSSPLSQHEKEDPAVTDAIHAATEKYKAATERESLTRTVLIELCAILKVEEAQQCECAYNFCVLLLLLR